MDGQATSLRTSWPLSLLLVAATGAASCSRSTGAACGADPRDFCALFRKLSDSFSEQERATIISLTAAPVRREPGFEGLLDRTQGLLHLGRDDAVLTYLHRNRVDDDRRAYEAILCGYAWWLKSGSVDMESLLQKGDGACWWVPQSAEFPAVAPILVVPRTVEYR
jgi:hypothetical protein